MLIHSGVPSYHWEDATLHANFIRNHVSTRVLTGVTPYEKFWGRKPDLTWIKPYGCLVYVITHKELRESKFEASALPGVMIGVLDHHSTYKIKMLHSKGVKIACDIRFYEDVFPYRQNPMNDLKWLNPKDMPMAKRDTDEILDPLSEIQEKDPEHELQQLYQCIPAYSDVPNTGMKHSQVVSPISLDKEMERTQDSLEKPSRAPKAIHMMSTSIHQVDIEEIIIAYALNIGAIEPRTLDDALNGPNAEEWYNACRSEFNAIAKTGTFKHMTSEAQQMLNKGEIAIHGTRPVLKVKLDENG